MHCSNRVDETLAGAFSQIQTADFLGDLESNSRDASFEAPEFFSLFAARFLLLGAQFFKLLQPNLAMLADVLNTLDGPGAILFGFVFVAGQFRLFGEGYGVANIYFAGL